MVYTSYKNGMTEGWSMAFIVLSTLIAIVHCSYIDYNNHDNHNNYSYNDKIPYHEYE